MLFGKRTLRLKETDRQAMRRAGAFNAELMDYLRQYMKAGISTGEIDHLIYDYTRRHGHSCPTFNYQGFPANCCTSINEVVCHGIPGPYQLKHGDIINVDITTKVHGWLGDQSETFIIGQISDETRVVVQCAFDAMWRAIDNLKPYCRVAAIGEAVVAEARKFGFGVVKDFVGHGIGQQFHQEPSIPHYPSREARQTVLEPGMCFTVEPMINGGTEHTVVDKVDGWTVRTKDGKMSAQFEHTVLMTENGPEVLTLTKHGPQRGHKF